MITLLTFWAIRNHQRTEALNVLNGFSPFVSPPLELNFSAILADNESNRMALQMGGREGFWKIGPRSLREQTLEVRLTDQGQRLFSVVGNQLVATFKAGRRQVTRIDDLDGTFPSRHVRFHFTWNQLHPGNVVLGPSAPEIGKEYEGEALLYYEAERWRILHWSTPDFDLAVARFETLTPARR